MTSSHFWSLVGGHRQSTFKDKPLHKSPPKGPKANEIKKTSGSSFRHVSIIVKNLQRPVHTKGFSCAKCNVLPIQHTRRMIVGLKYYSMMHPTSSLILTPNANMASAAHCLYFLCDSVVTSCVSHSSTSDFSSFSRATSCRRSSKALKSKREAWRFRWVGVNSGMGSGEQKCKLRCVFSAGFGGCHLVPLSQTSQPQKGAFGNNLSSKQIPRHVHIASPGQVKGGWSLQQETGKQCKLAYLRWPPTD